MSEKQGLDLLKTILLADDNKSERSQQMKILVECGYDAFEAEDISQTMEKYKEVQPDLVIIILNPLGATWECVSKGLPIAKELIEYDNSALVIMTSSNGTHRNIIDAVQCGVKDLLTLPLYPNRLIEAVEKLIGKPNNQRQ